MPLPALALLLLLSAAPALGVGLGSIQGRVTDAEGAPIVGAEVSLRGESLWTARKVLTSRVGVFRFEALPTGDFAIEVRKTDFITAANEQVFVVGDDVIQVDFTLRPGRQSMFELAIDPVLDVTTARDRVVLDSSDLQAIPTEPTVERTLERLPGVVAETQSSLAVSGWPAADTEFVVDGLRYGDGSGGSGQPMSADWLDAVRVRALDPAASRGARPVIDLITRRGASQWRRDLRMSAIGGGLEGSARARPEDLSLSENRVGGDLRASASGDVIDARWRVFGALRLSDTDSSLRLRAPDSETALRFGPDQRERTFHLRSDVAASDRLQLTASVSRWRGIDTGRRPTGAQRPQGDGPADSERGTEGVNLRANWSISRDFELRASVGSVDGHLQRDAWAESAVEFAAGTEGVGLSRSLERARATIEVPQQIRRQDAEDERRHFWVDVGGLLAGGGDHFVKVGFESRRHAVERDSTAEAGYRLHWAWSPLGARSTFGSYFETRPRGHHRLTYRQDALYFEDLWRLPGSLRRWTLQLGLRSERQRAGGVELGWSDLLQPRLGLTWDVLGDGHWKIFGSMGVSYLDLFVGSAVAGHDWAHESVVLRPIEVTDWTVLLTDGPDATLAPGFQPTVFRGAAGTVIDEALEPARVEQLVGGTQVQFLSELILTMRFSYRRTRDGIREVQAPEGTLLLTPGLGLGRRDELSGEELPRLDERWLAAELTLDVGVGARWKARASYSWSRLEGNHEREGWVAQTQLGTPSFFDVCRSFARCGLGDISSELRLLDRHREHLASAWLAVQPTERLDVTLLQRFRSGTPHVGLIETLQLGPAGRVPTTVIDGPPQGTLPDLHRTDLSLQFRLLANKPDISLSFFTEVLNLFDDSTVTTAWPWRTVDPVLLQGSAPIEVASRGVRADDRFGEPLFTAPPRRVRLGLRLGF